MADRSDGYHWHQSSSYLEEEVCPVNNVLSKTELTISEGSHVRRIMSSLFWSAAGLGEDNQRVDTGALKAANWRISFDTSTTPLAIKMASLLSSEKRDIVNTVHKKLRTSTSRTGRVNTSLGGAHNLEHLSSSGNVDILAKSVTRYRSYQVQGKP